MCGLTCAACKDGFFGLDQVDYFGCRSKCPLSGLSDHVLGEAKAQGGTDEAKAQAGPGHGKAQVDTGLTELPLGAWPGPGWVWERGARVLRTVLLCILRPWQDSPINPSAFAPEPGPRASVVQSPR